MSVESPVIRRCVTIKDIAREVGLSPTTVSLTLGGISKSASIPAATRKLVLDAAKRLDYQPNHNARSLVNQRSSLIGLLVSESESSWVIPSIVAGVQNICDAEGYSIVFYTHHGATDEELHCHNCVNRRVEALIVSGAETRENTDQILHLQKRGIPIVEVFNHSIPSVPAVRTDMYAAGRLAAEHLLALGHRKVAHFTHERYLINPDALEMWQGFSQTLAAAGVAAQVWTSILTPERPLGEPFFAEALAAARARLAQAERPTAVWCYNSEHHAQALLWACREQNLRVPQDLSVMGHNDIVFLSPALTTLRHPLYAIGQRATELIFDMLAQKPLAGRLDILLESEFIVRASTAPPPQG